ncbi:P-loop NTPase fold protein [Streptomyces sp. NPDC056723]|uniref:KAP family P-loop NTPase fold protein n=1 Tax=Streptomyces sp. NPDC056723 TaxID=3345925 RepID=UPI00369CFF72
MESRNLLGDDPVNAATDDLDRKRFGDHVVQVINRVRVQSESSVIALVGAWGSGKSSLLEMIKDSIDDAEFNTDPNAREWRVAEFNPWVHSDPVAMYVGFYSELRACLPGKKRWSEARENLGKWVQTAAPLGKLGGVARIDASTMLEKLAEKISGDTSAAAKKELAEKSLKDCDISILVVMDDVDRLTPDELLEVFKMIRLVGRLPNVYYLLAYDEKSLTDVLCRTDLAYESPSRARDYLEKMIQVRLDLPQLTEGQSERLVNRSLGAVLENNEITLSESSASAVAHIWRETLSHRIATPRSVRSFFAQVDSSYGTVAQEVNFEDFLALTFLRTHEPRVYKEIQKRGGELTMSSIVPTIKRNESLQDKLDRWEANLRDWEVESQHIRGTLQLLSRLFLPIRSAVERSEYGADWLQGIAQRKGVGHADYFARYFFFGVPSDDISDFLVERSLALLSEGSADTAEVHSLRDSLKRFPDRTVRKIENFGNLNEETVRNLLDLMAGVYLEIPDNVGFLGALSRVSFEGLAETLYSNALGSAMAVYLDNAMKTEGGYCLAVRGLRRARHRAVRSDKQVDREKYSKILLDLIKRKFDEVKSCDIHDVTQEVFSTVYPWVELEVNTARAFMREQAENSAWPLLHIMEKLVTRGRSSRYPGDILSSLDEGVVESLLGLDYVFEKLRDEIDSASTDFVMEGLPDTPENRRRFALAALSFTRIKKHTGTG